MGALYRSIPVFASCLDTGAGGYTTAWTKGGERSASITFDEQRDDSLVLSVAANAPAGRFWIEAAVAATCECRDNDDETVDCHSQRHRMQIDIGS